MLAALAPAALGLAALAATPVVIHLLTRRRAQPRPFPALAFLARVEHGRARTRRLRDAVILSLRTLAVAAAALAAAGLIWRGSLLGDARRPAVVVLDASASMRQVADGATAWSRARAIAGRLVDQLAPRPVAVVVAGAPARASGEPSVQRGPALALVAEAEPGFGDGDPAGALALAARLMPGGGDCFLVTDCSRSSLAGVDPAALPKGLTLHLVDAGGGGDNAAVTGLAVEPGVVVAGMPATVSARVANHGAAARDVAVALRVGRERRLLPLSLPPGAVRTVEHRVVLDSAGSVEVEAAIDGGDALESDDRRTGVLTAVAELTTVLASDGDRDGEAGALRPLLAALAAAGLAPRLTDAAGLAGEALARPGAAPALLVTADLRQPALAKPAIAAHLAAGGAWLHVVVGDGDAALAEVGGQAAPTVPGARVDVSDQERGEMAVAQARLDHPLLAGFQGREALLRAIGAWRYRLTPTGAAADAAVLLTYADGAIALAERPAGAGRWLLLNCSPAAADGNLARSEALPLLMAALPATLLPPRSERLARAAGSALPATGAWTGPDGRSAPVAGGQLRLLMPGVYRSADGQAVAAAVPALESDLRRFDPKAIGVAAVAPDAALADAAVTPLWPWLLLIAALALGCESALAGGLGARVGSRP